MTIDLPPGASLKRQRNWAKRLLRSFRERDPSVAKRIREVLPGIKNFSDERTLSIPFSLKDAQQVIAVEHGFDSWRELRTYFDAGQTSTKGTQSMNINELLNLLVKTDGATDVIITDELPPVVTINGVERRAEYPPLTVEDIHKLPLEVMTDEQRTHYETKGFMDWRFEWPGMGVFRNSASRNPPEFTYWWIHKVAPGEERYTVGMFKEWKQQHLSN